MSSPMFTHLLPDRRIVENDENISYFLIQLSTENERHLLLFKDIQVIFCSMFCSFCSKLNVLKNSPGYRPRQVCDFAQGDIRSRILGGS